MTQQELNNASFEEKLHFAKRVCSERIPSFLDSDPQFYFCLQVLVSNQLYTKREVEDIINKILNYPDILMDATQNENTDWCGESILSFIENIYNKQINE